MTKLFGLVGQHISYSLSPVLFADIFQREHIEADYQLFDLDTIGDLASVIAQSPLGLNVTQPYKESIIPFLDRLDETAQLVGAVNTIAIVQGEMIGYNTDAIGFLEAIQPYLPVGARKALVLGTGGASKAAIYAFDTLGIETTVVSRQPKAGQLSYESLTDKEIASYAIIVQCTPLGSARYPGEFPPIPYTGIHKEQLAYDMVYNPTMTPFLEKANAQGAAIVNGKHMLELQAQAAWRIWKAINFQ